MTRIKDTSFTGKNFLLGIDSKYGTQIWNYEIPDGVFSSPCLVDDNSMTVVVGSMDKFLGCGPRTMTDNSSVVDMIWMRNTLKGLMTLNIIQVY